MDANAYFKEIERLQDQWVYRYRPLNPLTIKELMYGEMFFSYREELNDPLDHKCDLIIKKGSPKIIEYFVLAAQRSMPIERLRPQDFMPFCAELCERYSRSDYNVTEFTENEVIRNTFEQIYNRHKLVNFPMFYESFSTILLNLIPNKIKSVSFSSSGTDPYLWAMYSSRHHGYCLIFSPTKNKIYLRKKPGEKYKGFALHDIQYSENSEIDIACLFQNGIPFENPKSFDVVRQKSILTKNPSWKNEKEKRLVGDYSVSFSAKPIERNIESSTSRTYYYDPRQLVGVILGAGLSKKERSEVLEICKSKNERFRIYQAETKGNSVLISLTEVKFNK